MTAPRHSPARSRHSAATHRRSAWLRAAWAPSLLIAGLLLVAACGGGPTATVPQCGDPATLLPGDSVDGTLDSADDRFDGAFIDYYTLDSSGVRQFVFTHSSSDFDPLLLVFDASGEIVAQAFQEEGSPPGTNETAALLQTLDSGCFLLGATVWTRGDTGAYTLTVEPADL